MKRALIDLERQVGDALVSDDRSGIDVLGYGEISTVLRLTIDGQSYACKRLPPFPENAIDPYREACTAYLVALGERGIRTASSTIEIATRCGSSHWVGAKVTVRRIPGSITRPAASTSAVSESTS